MLKSIIRKLARWWDTYHDVRQVAPGDWLKVELASVEGGIATVQCQANDVKRKSMLVGIVWANHEEMKIPKTQLLVLHYGGSELRNFNLLNPNPVITEKSLRDQLQLAIDSENYELAKDIKHKLDKMSKLSAKA
jgi:hypothetical protein